MSFKIAISIPVTGNMQTLKKQIDSAFRQGAYAVELRFDYWKKNKLTQRNIEEIKSYTDKPAIFTFRSPKEGGHMNIDDKTRLRYIYHAIQLHFRYVDIELETIRTNNIQIQTLKHNLSSKIIISYHHFSAIKDFESLYTIRDEMIASNADICKIAIASDGETTNKAILRLIEETKRRNTPIIAIAMGEKGKTVRIEGMKSGNYMTYAALDEDSKTTEGQLTIHELTEKS